MDEMIRASSLSVAITMAFFYGFTALASVLDWPHTAGAVIASLSLVLLVGSRLLLMGAAERHRVRVVWSRRARAAWRRVRGSGRT